jgi:glucose/arabinose dehydrogenase
MLGCRSNRALPVAVAGFVVVFAGVLTSTLMAERPSPSQGGPGSPAMPGVQAQSQPQPPSQPAPPPAMPGAGRAPALPGAQTYATYCVGCHGSTLTGGRAPTLLDETWRFGGDDASVRSSIREGRAGTEMPPFKTLLTDENVTDVIVYIRAQALLAKNSAARAQSPAGQILKTEKYAIKLEVVAEGLATPWGLAFLPDGRLLVTERPGSLRIIEKGKLLPKPIDGLPPVWTQQDGGLFDVAVHPDYARNGWIYLSYAEPGPDNTSMTTICRGRIEDGRWVDQQLLYHAPPALFYPTNVHYGSRFIFDKDGHLFYSIGERGHEMDAQDLSLPTGKVHRVNDDGSVPRDNPFVSRAGALASIWSYGHRNPQGFAFHPVTGKLWSTEHGPVGGDELNRIEPGHNYGWPIVTSGKSFPRPAAPPPATATVAGAATVTSARAGTGATATAGTTAGSTEADAPPPAAREGMDSPITQWTPSIAPSGIAFYTGSRFPDWTNSLFVTGLVGEALRRLETRGDEVVHEEVLFKGFGRVRAVVVGPDGYLYIALNIPGARLSDTTPGMIIRLVEAVARDGAARETPAR